MRGTLALFASTRRETALACLFMLCVPGFQLLSLVPDMTHWGLCPSALAGGDLLLDLLRGHVRGFTFVWLVPYVVVLASLCMGPLATGRLREDVLVMAFGSRWAFWTARCLAVTVTAAVEWVALLVGGVLGVLVVGGHPSLEACVAGYSLWGDAGQTLAYDSGVVLTFLVLVLMSLIALALFHALCSAVLNAAVALIATFAMLALSALAPVMPLPCSWTMASRCSLFTAQGPSSLEGVMAFLVVMIASYFIGALVFAQRDVWAGEAL